MINPTKVMLDLETFGTKPGSVIVAIGAVKFSLTGGILESFYMRVDAKSCIDAGLKMDPDTVVWWLKQGDAARLEITKPSSDLLVALEDFRNWLGAASDSEVWGNGAAFDNVLLADAYEALRIDRPWKFWNDRCYRTVKSLRPDIPLPRTGTHHNALDDAKTQALHLIQILTSGV